MKKKTLTLLVFSCSLLTSFAQTAKEEIYADILKSGSNYMAYQAPTKALTKAPKGYEPFYMSHYGRHGSRWLINENDYTSVIRVFRRANELGKLTPLGKEALAKLERFIPTTKGRLGELSDIGEQQHHGIGRRMTENFPEIFSGKDAEVDARSTVVVRCILSMTAECEELTAFNPQMKMHNDVSESYQYYLNHNFSQRLKDASRDRGSIVDEYKKKYTSTSSPTCRVMEMVRTCGTSSPPKSATTSGKSSTSTGISVMRQPHKQVASCSSIRLTCSTTS